ncbi:hypothetical protein [Sphingobacterium paludis]|nr:hypothetical protein [Sphingobacterium paludis]
MRNVKESNMFISLALIHVGHTPPAFTHPEPNEDDHGNTPEPDEADKFPEEGDEVENIPPMQPDVDPLERENPDVEELEDNEPLHQEDEDPEATLDQQDLKPTGETIVVDRRTGKDEL